jgi:hypothetical protein
VSNTRRARWSEAEVDASNAERLLAEFWTEGEAYAARTVILRSVIADYQVTDPGIVAQMEQAAMELGTEYWAGIYRETMASAP